MEVSNLLQLFLIISTLEEAFATILLLELKATNLTSAMPGGQVYMEVGVNNVTEAGTTTDNVMFRENVDWKGYYKIKVSSTSNDLNFNIRQITYEGSVISLARTEQPVTDFLSSNGQTIAMAAVPLDKPGSHLYATVVMIKDDSGITWKFDRYVKDEEEE